MGSAISKKVKRTEKLVKIPVFVGEKAEDLALVPEWSHGVMVYPPGSARTVDRYTDFLSDDQWMVLADLLAKGFVVGLMANSEEIADAACAVGQHVREFPIVAQFVEGDLMVYFHRTDLVKRTGKGGVS